MDSTKVTGCERPAEVARQARWQIALGYFCGVVMIPIVGMAFVAFLATLLPVIVLALPFVAGSAWRLVTPPAAARSSRVPPTAGSPRLRPALGPA